MVILCFFDYVGCFLYLNTMKTWLSGSTVDTKVFFFFKQWVISLHKLPVLNCLSVILQEMSCILMLNWCLYSLFHLSCLFSSLSYPLFCCPSLLPHSPSLSPHLSSSYRRTSETLSQASLKATAAFSNVGSAIGRKLEDVRSVRQETSAWQHIQ